MHSVIQSWGESQIRALFGGQMNNSNSVPLKNFNLSSCWSSMQLLRKASGAEEKHVLMTNEEILCSSSWTPVGVVCNHVDPTNATDSDLFSRKCLSAITVKCKPLPVFWIINCVHLFLFSACCYVALILKQWFGSGMFSQAWWTELLLPVMLAGMVPVFTVYKYIFAFFM